MDLSSGVPPSGGAAPGGDSRRCEHTPARQFLAIVGRRFSKPRLFRYSASVKLERTSVSDLLSRELRTRAQVHAADEVTLLLVRDSANDVGIVILDFTTGDEGEAILVEIYVLPALRSRGIGVEALKLAAAFARDRECAWDNFVCRTT